MGVDDTILHRAKQAELVGYIPPVFDDTEICPVIELALHKQRMDKLLKEREQWLATTLKSISDAVIITDTCGLITFMNSTAELLTGWTQAEAAGKHLTDVFITFNETIHHVIEHFPYQPLRLGFDTDLEAQTILKARDGREFPIHSNSDPIHDDAGSVTGTVIIFRDITPHRRSEEALRQYAKRLENLHEIDRAILSAQSLEEIARTTLQRLQQLVPYTRASIVVFDFTAGEAEVLAVSYDGETSAGVGARLPLDLYPIARATWHNNGCIDEDGQKPTPSAPVVQTTPAIETRTCLNVPLVIQGTLIGSLNLGADDPRAFGSEQVEIANEIANQLAVAIQHNRLFVQAQQHAADLEQRVAERTTELVAINKRLQQEIAERKHVEKALTKAFARLEELNRRLSRSYDTLQTLLEGLDDGLLLLNTDQRVLAANQAMAALFNSSPEALIGQRWSELCQQTDPVFPGEQALLTLRDGRARRQRERFTPHGGQTHIMDMQTLPLHGPGQSVDQVILHVVDVTERVHMEALVIENERFAASGKLAATIAHEINTPLQAIQTFLYLANETVDVQRNQYLALAGEEIDRISRIVQQLLDLYRPKMKSPDTIDINTIIDRVLLLTGGTLTKHGIDVERDLTLDLPPLWGDADQLTQVFLNLTLNAIAAMPNGGKLRFYTRAYTMPQSTDSTHQATNLNQEKWTITHTPLSAVIQITDTGVGIPRDIQPRIFDPFFTTKPDGSGLGLTVSRKIVVQHGGTITVHSEPHIGTTFTILLPLEPVDERIDEG